MATTIDGIAGLGARVGSHLGYSDWHEITPDQVQLFADATGDHQWIHLDAERAKAGPFGTTIAHGFLTLSLAPVLLNEIFEVSGVAMAVNYGLNKVRFPAPVPVGSKIRLGGVIDSIDDIGGGVQATITGTWEVEGGTKPVCVAEIILRYYT
jgi:acyl dehydratase